MRSFAFATFLLWALTAAFAIAAPATNSTSISTITTAAPDSSVTSVNDVDLYEFDEISNDPNAIIDQDHYDLMKRQCSPEEDNIFCEDGWVRKSPYATCDQGDYAVFVGLEGEVYTICCPDDRDGSTRPDKVDGFQCCKDWDYSQCAKAHSVQKCMPGGNDGKQHNLTEQTYKGLKCCLGDASSDLHPILVGLGWMGGFWLLCVGFFWDM
jgi:hypothetical protein